ncbi:polysaccharide biosynthesis/export family protein [Sphingomonas sediminicola]|uniref:polysaccharide biosynthesis/export family protein n=1 Tax=Sphingomonas sediminicola TaxID=386874 RepID=UPI003CEDDC58
MRKAFVALIAGILFQTVLLQPLAAQTRRPAPAQATAGPAYRINPGDDIEIMVWGDDRLQRTVRVLPDGTFAFPWLGSSSRRASCLRIWSGSSRRLFSHSIVERSPR